MTAESFHQDHTKLSQTSDKTIPRSLMKIGKTRKDLEEHMTVPTEHKDGDRKRRQNVIYSTNSKITGYQRLPLRTSCGKHTGAGSDKLHCLKKTPVISVMIKYLTMLELISVNVKLNKKTITYMCFLHLIYASSMRLLLSNIWSLKCMTFPLYFSVYEYHISACCWRKQYIFYERP